MYRIESMKKNFFFTETQILEEEEEKGKIIE